MNGSIWICARAARVLGLGAGLLLSKAAIGVRGCLPMDAFAGIRFTGDENQDYRASIARDNPKENGHEYEFFMRFINIFGEGIVCGGNKPYMFGDIDPGFVERRFFGAHPYLIPEQKAVNGFPDFFLLNDDAIVIIDHFKVDASMPFGKPAKPSGSEYMRFRSTRMPEAARSDSDELETALNSEGIVLSAGALAESIAAKFAEKAAKVDTYRERVREYIATGCDERIVADALSRPDEVWLMIEDVSPSCGFGFIGRTLSALLEEYPSIGGLLYISNPYPDVMFSSPEQVAIIANDEKARSELACLDS